MNEPNYQIKDSQIASIRSSQSTRKGNRKKKARKAKLNELFRDDIIGKSVLRK